MSETFQESGYLWTTAIPDQSQAVPTWYFCFHKGLLYQWYGYASQSVVKDYTRSTFTGIWVLVPTI